MLNFPITTQFTRKRLRNILMSVVNSSEIESRYITLQIQFILKSNDIIDFGNVFMLDRLNTKSIKGCKFYFELTYNNEVLNNNDLEITQVIVNYNKVKRTEYLKNIKNFYQDK